MRQIKAVEVVVGGRRRRGWGEAAWLRKVGNLAQESR